MDASGWAEKARAAFAKVKSDTVEFASNAHDAVKKILPQTSLDKAGPPPEQLSQTGASVSSSDYNGGNTRVQMMQTHQRAQSAAAANSYGGAENFSHDGTFEGGRGPPVGAHAPPPAEETGRHPLGFLSNLMSFQQHQQAAASQQPAPPQASMIHQNQNQQQRAPMHQAAQQISINRQGSRVTACHVATVITNLKPDMKIINATVTATGPGRVLTVGWEEKLLFLISQGNFRKTLRVQDAHLVVALKALDIECMVEETHEMKSVRLEFETEEAVRDIYSVLSVE